VDNRTSYLDTLTNFQKLSAGAVEAILMCAEATEQFANTFDSEDETGSAKWNTSRAYNHAMELIGTTELMVRLTSEAANKINNQSGFAENWCRIAHAIMRAKEDLNTWSEEGISPTKEDLAKLANSAVQLTIYAFYQSIEANDKTNFWVESEKHLV
jgi:hypothetical protein